MPLASHAVFDADGTAFLDANAIGARTRADLQVSPVARRPEVRFPASKPHTSLGIALQVADTFVLGTIIVGRGWHAGLDTCVMEGIAQGISAELADVHRAMLATDGSIAARIGLDALQIREHVLVAPAGVAEIVPMVVLGGLSRTHSMPLMVDEPPSTRPRGQNILRLPRLACGSV